MKKLPLVLCTLIMLIAFSSKLFAFSVPYESWLGAYMSGNKIGYYSFKINDADYDGKAGYRIHSVLSAKLNMMGSDMQLLVSTVIFTDSDYRPLKEDFYWSSGGKTTRVQATFSPDKVDCTVSAGSGAQKKVVPIPEGVELVSDTTFDLENGNMQPGEKKESHFFNPLSLSIEKLTSEVIGKETIEVDGKSYETWLVENSTPLGKSKIWQDNKGDVVKLTGMMGITMVKQSKEQAMSFEGTTAPAQIDVLSSIKTDTKINSPRSCRYLDITFEGLPSDTSLAISDERQTAESAGNKSTRFKITAKEYDSDNAIEIPVNSDGFEEYLAVTPYIDHDTRSVREKALEIVEGERNAHIACSKLRAWIYANLKSQTNIGILRCTSDVLKSKVGVCRDYTVLFAGFARSLGIPTKVVSGLLYTNGAFYYHAWVECYVGKWVPFDATMSTDFVDATHIKMTEGDATKMLSLSSVIGSLDATINEYK